jgi:two-component system sensor histidine kinase/response regulator
MMQTANSPSVEDESSGVQTQDKLILLVDDDNHLRRILCDYLEKLYRVIETDDGSAAFAMVKEHQPDLIISDISMPMMSGHHFLKLVRDNPTTATIPFVFLSGHSDYENMREGMGMGADDYLYKPFSLVDLNTAIQAQFRKQETTKDKIEDTVRIMRDSLTYGLPHELRTPLFQMVGYTEILRYELAERGVTDMDELLEGIDSAGRRLHHLVENYTLHLQLETLALDAERKKQLRNSLLKDAGAVIKQAAEEVAASHGRTDDLDIKVATYALCMSETNLKKIITELIDNACKFSKAGTPIQVRSKMRNGCYQVGVQDSGHGMKPEDVEKIGTPFTQFERETYEQQGIGLGFAIVNQLVTLYEGTVNTTSKYGNWTRVIVDLPL